MSLSILDVEVIENIVNRVDIDDKTNLFMTGNALLLAKLSRSTTVITMLPHYGVRGYYLSEDENGLRANFEYSTLTDMRESVNHGYATDGKMTYSHIPLHYKNATSAVIHGVHLERTLAALQKLTHLHVYINQKCVDLLRDIPSVLTSLHLSVNAKCQVIDIVCALPRTLKSLIFDHEGSNSGLISFTPHMVSKLPQGLVTLMGISVRLDHQKFTLPKSLTKLGCGRICAIMDDFLPATIEHVVTDYFNVEQFLHLRLRSLTCDLSHTKDLTSLRFLEVLRAKYYQDVNNDHLHGWDHAVEYPPSLTDLTINSSYPICFRIPPSVKKLSLTGRYNAFEESTSTWRFNCWNVQHIPSDVVHAYMDINQVWYADLKSLFTALAPTVETINLSVYATSDNLHEYDFSIMTRCIKLILPCNIRATSLPHALEYMDIYDVREDIRYVDFPSTLQYVRTRYNMWPYQIKSISPLYLECGRCHIMSDIECISHIPEIVFPVYKCSLEGKLPPLPSNAQYKYI